MMDQQPPSYSLRDSLNRPLMLVRPEEDDLSLSESFKLDDRVNLV